MSQTPQQADQRRYLRVPVRVEVHADGDRDSADYAINVSKSGMCLQSSEQREPGEALKLSFRLAPTDETLELAARVIWCTRENERAPGMTYSEVGIRFSEVSPWQRALLESFVDYTSRFTEKADPGHSKPDGWTG